MSFERGIRFGPDVSSKPSPQVQPCYSWLDALARADIDGMAANMTEDYTQEMNPFDPTYPVLNTKKACTTFWTQLLTNFEMFLMTVYELKETPGQVVMQAKSDARTKGGFKYDNGYTFTFSVAQQPDGSHKLTHTTEFFKAPEQILLLRRSLGEDV
ncbi:hypothetical protein EIP91_011803 [Steccherinum ochraceum]|uniref:SnoaL-like domain-containing protein n=1 Tax=Steccherinum ochraceum TaxID=92696 RepID=A0A4R0RR85_9APHY|nr:hypothetical protein EIP91_011803 [Steccherinum ochraceum]